MLNPEAIFRAEPDPPRRIEETSPATHLAKVREHKKRLTGSYDETVGRYESAVNRLWRTRYTHIYQEENIDGA